MNYLDGEIQSCIRRKQPIFTLRVWTEKDMTDGTRDAVFKHAVQFYRTNAAKYIKTINDELRTFDMDWTAFIKQ